VDAPSRLRPQVLVVVAQVPDEIGHPITRPRPVVRDGRDPSQCVIGLGHVGVHLADDRVFGALDHQGRHGGADAVAAAQRPHRLKRSWRIGQAQFGCLGEQFDHVVESAVVNGGRVEVNQIGQCQTVGGRQGHGNPLLRRMSSRHCLRVWPVCCMHTRTGDSSAMGKGSSVASVVTVGLGTSPWLDDQMVAPVFCSVEQ
jgi:hypothetical protein